MIPNTELKAALALSERTPDVGPVVSLPGYGKVKEKQLAGYLPVDDSRKSYIYFWFFESQSNPATAGSIPTCSRPPTATMPMRTG